MITFLIFLVSAAAIAYAVAFFTSRFLIRVYPDRMVLASIGAVFLTVATLLIFHQVAAFLIDVAATSPEMGGLAWLLTIISYVIAVVVSIPCLIAGIVVGLKKPRGISVD